MAARTVPTDYPSTIVATSSEAHASGVAWPAVFAGATIIAALALLLITLGVGFGLAAISPWSGAGASATTLGAAAIAWLVVTQVVSSAMGGYLAGRLRTVWTSIHTDEVYFRDTAHGFLAWGLAWISTAALLATAAATLAGSAPASPDRAASRGLDVQWYYDDALFRHNSPVPVPDATRSEATVILGRLLTSTGDTAADETYLSQLVVATTGLSESEASARVKDVETHARAELDAVRKTSARASFWLFISLLAGAYCASHAATIGGRRRDHVPAR
jgi:hypothetical protein